MLPTFLAVVFGLLAALAGAMCVWVFSSRQALRVRRDELERELVERRTQIEQLRQENQAFERDLALARQMQLHLEKRMLEMKSQHEEAQKQSIDTFKVAAHDALDRAQKQFLLLATKTFEGDKKDVVQQLEQRKQAIESMVKPIREALTKQELAFTEMDKRHREAHGGLTEQLRNLFTAQDQLRSTASNLVTALRRPEVRGRWGEMQLRRVAELAGMIPHCDFEEQVTVRHVDGVQKPDMVIQLPAGRQIVVDAKTPLHAYLEAIECASDDDRKPCLERHAQQIEEQVRRLASKDYQRQFDRSPDLVVLFIPGESFLHAASQMRPDLIERAMAMNVVIATPTTLISLLKAVEMGWREERLAESAEQIRDLGQQLHERLAVLVDKADKLGRNLESATKSYNDFVSSLESRFVVTARKFKELGADSKKELPAEGEITIIETSPRLIESERVTG